eukprot:gene26018-32541_t
MRLSYPHYLVVCPQQRMRKLFMQHVIGACIVKKGVEEVDFVSAKKVHAIDTVGAGDSFIGSFASHLTRGSSLHAAVSSAVNCASISVTRKGAQKSYPKLDELEEVDRPQARREEQWHVQYKV